GRGGRVVNVTSLHEHAPRVGAAPYCAAKGGLGLLTQVAALELAEHGITVNAVAPGEIATAMTGQEDEDPHPTDRAGVPLGRPGDAREVAAVVAFLCGPDATYVTGASWAVDGGMLRMGPMAGSHLTSDDWRRPGASRTDGTDPTATGGPPGPVAPLPTPTPRPPRTARAP